MAPNKSCLEIVSPCQCIYQQIFCKICHLLLTMVMKIYFYIDIWNISKVICNIPNIIGKNLIIFWDNHCEYLVAQSWCGVPQGWMAGVPQGSLCGQVAGSVCCCQLVAVSWSSIIHTWDLPSIVSDCTQGRTNSAHAFIFFCIFFFQFPYDDPLNLYDSK